MDPQTPLLENGRVTIVAPATPTGYSGLAVIRISGEKAWPIATRIFVPIETVDKFQANRAYHGRIVTPEKEETVDDAVVIFFLAPRSYTGEDLVEISTHGNPLIVERIVKLCTGLGARIAGRGEFTRRALLNNKFDLLQAEAVLDIINAPSDDTRRLALAQYEGRLSEVIRGLQSAVVGLLSLVEAAIDFPEEEVTRYDSDKITGDIRGLATEIDSLLDGAEAGVKAKAGYRVVILGRTNVGKSTIFNRLLGFDRAIVHDTPGTTRDYLEEGIQIGGLFVRLTDTAGFLPKPTGAERLAGDRSQQMAGDADLVILVFDGSEPLNDQDFQLFGQTQGLEKVLVINKIDLNLKLKEGDFLADALKLSARTGENISALRTKIAEALKPVRPRGDLLLTRTRHVQTLRDIRLLLNQAQAEIINPETLAFELHAVQDRLGELTGQVLRREILDKIFDEFCIGK
jgi:tRNA modification GTPase